MTTSRRLAEHIDKWIAQGKTKEALAALRKLSERYQLQALMPVIYGHLATLTANRADSQRLNLYFAHPVSNQLVPKIKSHLAIPDGVEVVQQIDEKLVGGFIAEYSWQRYDASIRRNLDKLNEALTR